MKAAVAVDPPASVATTVEPLVPLGTANVHEKSPSASVVREPLVQLAMVTPSKTSEARGDDTENPEPETVTVAPIGPCPGEAEIDEVVTVNEPEAV